MPTTKPIQQLPAATTPPSDADVLSLGQGSTALKKLTLAQLADYMGSKFPATIDGVDGRTLLNGNAPPVPELGADGDFYINDATWHVHGPKAGGNWPAGVTMLGGDTPLDDAAPNTSLVVTRSAKKIADDIAAAVDPVAATAASKAAVDDVTADDAPTAGIFTRSAAKIAALIAAAVSTTARVALNRDALASTALTGLPAYLFEKPRQGWHDHYSAAEFLAEFGVDVATVAAADPVERGHVVSDGAGGAWVRRDRYVEFEHFGVVGYQAVAAARTAADASAEINAALAVGALLNRPAALRRFYPIGATVTLTGNNIYGTGRDNSGLVAINSTPANTNLVYGADFANFMLRGWSIWGAQGSVRTPTLVLQRCKKFEVSVGTFDGKPLSYQFIDCDNFTLRDYSGGATLEADYQLSNNRPFEIVSIDGCASPYVVGGFAEKTSFGIVCLSDDSWRKSYFSAAAATDELTILDSLVFANANTGDACILITHNDGALPAGLTPSELRTYTAGGLVLDDVVAAGYAVYWVIKTATGFKLATSYANALAGTAIDLTTDGTTGAERTQITLLLRTSVCAVDTAADTLTVSPGLYAMCSTGDKCCWHQKATGYPAPTTYDTTYYIIKTGTPNVLKIATTNANALAGTAIDLTANGGGVPVIILGPKEKYSNNDHVSYQPYSHCKHARLTHFEIGRHQGHAVDMQVAAFLVDDFYIHDNEEAAGSVRNAVQAKNSYGNGLEMGVFSRGHCARVKTPFGSQEGQYIHWDHVSAFDFTSSGILANSTPYVKITEPVLRAGGQATDARAPIFLNVISSAGFSVSGGAYEPSPNGKSRFAYFSASGAWSFQGKPALPANLTDGTATNWAGGIYADAASAGFSIGNGFVMGQSVGTAMRHYIAALTGRYGVSGFREVPTSVVGVSGVAVLRDGVQVCRWSMQAMTAVDAATRLRAGRVGSAGSMVTALQPPTGAGARKDYLSAAKVTADPTTDLFTVPADWVTSICGSTPASGNKVRVSSASNNLPGGLLEGTDYFVIYVSATTIKLATSAANATAGTAVDITSAGVDVFINNEGSNLTTANGLAAEVTVAGSAGQSVMVEASLIPGS